MRATATRLTIGSLRELATVGVVSALSAAYGAALMTASDMLSVYAVHKGGSPGRLLDVVADVFILIALFVSGIVISNGVGTVIAGRRNRLRLLRLVGATSAQLRASITRAVVLVAALGAVGGAVLGTIGGDITRIILVHNGTLAHGGYRMLPPGVLVAVAAVVVTGAIAARAGTRATLAGFAAAPVLGRVGAGRRVFAVVAALAGGALLALAAVLGEHGNLIGFVVAFLGAATVSVGALVGAQLIVPTLVRLGGRLLGGSAASAVARKNAVGDPHRTTRSVLGLLIGVTLVTTIASGMTSVSRSVDEWDLTPANAAATRETLAVMTAILLAVVAISVVVSAVGFVSTMSLTVIGRTAEIGMLRTMGFTARQVRSMIFRESLAMSGTAVATGLLLGILFGTLGSQSLVGALTSGVPIGLPWPALVAIVVGTVGLALVAALPPSRRAVAVSPVEALRIGAQR
ncbi:ABC transporter permease [Gordonia sp. DT30]|uniref:ABC transporter permease n=1 Tax=unclassified Gordonia (in: high G+C Gram-positive bacteria) TaxID=2657482 RepID=UPI003CF5A619